MNSIKFNKSISIFILILFIIFTLTGCATTASTNILDIDEYLEKNHASIDLQDEKYIKGFSILDKDIKKYDIFLTGELHQTKKNYDLMLAFIKYFNKKAGVKYILYETGYSDTVYLNRYLETGDEKNLFLSFEHADISLPSNKEQYEFFKKLREYNMTLNDSKKVKLIGIDIEQHMTSAIACLKSILPKDEPPLQIADLINRFKELEYTASSWDERLEYTNFLKLIQKDMEENEELYKEYLGDKYFDFSMVLDNLATPGEAYYSYAQSQNYDDLHSTREKVIYNSFVRVYEHFPKGKYFGQFGSDHIHQKDIMDYMYDKGRFGIYLNQEDSPVKGKVLSIKYGYKDSYCTDKEYDPQSEKYKYLEGTLDSNLKNMEVLDKYLDNDITIFRLNGKGSPFKEEIYFVKAPDRGVTTDYFQYIVVIKDSKSATPFE